MYHVSDTNPSMLVASFLITAIVLVAIGWAVRAPRESDLLAVVPPSAAAELSEAQRRGLRQRLHWETRAKWMGALVGFTLPGFLKPFFEFPGAINGFTLGFTGLLVGVVVGATRDAAPPGTHRVASLRERRKEEYAPSRSQLTARVLAVVAVGLATLSAPLGRTIGACVHPHMSPSSGSSIVAAAFAIASLGLMELALRRIVSRRQPAEPPALVIIDDTLRRLAGRSVAGASLALVILSLALALTAVFTSGPVCGPGEWTRVAILDLVFGIAGFVSAVGIWIHFSRSAVPSKAEMATPENRPS